MFRFLMVTLTLIFLANAAMSAEVVIMKTEKNPASAAIRSVFIPGLGQFYNEDIGKGFTMLLGWGVCWGLVIAGTEDDRVNIFTDETTDVDDDNIKIAAGFFALIGLTVWSAVDAHDSAIKYNKELRQARLRIAPMMARDRGFGARLSYSF